MNLPISIPAAADLNEYTIPGMYFCAENGSTVKNTPAPADSFSLFVEKTGAWGTGIKQTFTHFATGETCQRVLGYDTSGTKGPWVPPATATPPQEYDLPLAERWSIIDSHAATYSKDQFGKITIEFGLSSAELQSAQELIFTLPVGFRPSKVVSASVTFWSISTGGNPAVVNINPNGQGYLFNQNAGEAGNLHGNCIFQSGN